MGCAFFLALKSEIICWKDLPERRAHLPIYCPAFVGARLKFSQNGVHIRFVAGGDSENLLSFGLTDPLFRYK